MKATEQWFIMLYRQGGSNLSLFVKSYSVTIQAVGLVILSTPSE